MKTKQIPEQNLCIECYQPITNPICVDCLMTEVNYWMHDIGLDMQTSKRVFRRIKSRLLQHPLNNDTCVLCGKHTLSTCSYCFFLIAARALKKDTLNPEAVNNFIDTFSYHKGHEEYVI